MHTLFVQGTQAKKEEGYTKNNTCTLLPPDQSMKSNNVYELRLTCTLTQFKNMYMKKEQLPITYSNENITKTLTS